jgi:hypothetical protein
MLATMASDRERDLRDATTAPATSAGERDEVATAAQAPPAPGG